jgi:ectoine hydroxylase-related dioxygenase (phytanoyl-CoA dioxygenase family)
MISNHVPSSTTTTSGDRRMASSSAPIHAMLPEAHGHAAGQLESGHAAMSDLPNQMTLCMKSGDAVAMDYRLLHGTHGNASNARRDCILLSFAADWQQLPDDIKAA